MFTKKEAITNLHQDIAFYTSLWEGSGDILWKNAVEDKKQEMEMTEALPDDDNFFHNRVRLLSDCGFFQKTMDRMNVVFSKQI